jgi:hypothetical protein
MKKIIVFILILSAAFAFASGSYFVDRLTAAWKTDKILIVLAPLGYQSERVGYVEVPCGFITDLASVPKIPFIYEAFGGKANAPAVIHDYLLCVDSVPKVTSSDANLVFLEAMEASGVPSWIRHPMYWGVCIGKWYGFKKRTVSGEIVQ